MSPDTLKAAVIGLNQSGRALLQAAAEVEFLNISAVADEDTNLSRATAKEFNCVPYDDYRQLIMQNQFDCLLVACGLYSCAEHIRLAMKKGFNIFKLAPPARDFEEAAQFVRFARQQKVKFAIGNWRRASKSFLELHRIIQDKQIEQVFLITALCMTADKERLAWHTDPKLSGGGTLLRKCYGIIDQIIWNFSVPQEVYSLNTNQAADRQQRLYLTEDMATVSMKFSDVLLGNLIAAEYFGPEERFIKLYARDKIFAASDRRLTISSGLGVIQKQFTYDEDMCSCLVELLRNFVLSLISPDENKLISSAEENLYNMALIEASYLSARTGMPEDPRRIMQIPSDMGIL